MTTPMFEVLVGNEMLRTARFVGKFETEAEARAYCEKEASSRRKFATFQVYGPNGKPIGEVVRGTQ